LNARRRRGTPQAGFTLLELLVAMAIFGLMGAMAMGGLNAVITQQRLAESSMAEVRQLQRGVRILMTDLSQPYPRFVRDELGQSMEPPLAADGRGAYLLRLTRGGWRNPAGLPRGSLQRVQYRFEDRQLIRDYWPVLDHVLGTEPRSEVLLDGVVRVEFSFLDAAGEWQSVWPAPGRALTEPAVNPRAIRIDLELESVGEIRRLVELAG